MKIRDQNGQMIEIPALKGKDYILTEEDKNEIANKTADLIDQAECIPLGTVENKFLQLADRTITEVTAEDLKGLTTIGRNAFSYCKQLLSVTIPDNITIIENSAFSYCNLLDNVTIGDGVKTIGYSAFQGSGMTSVILGNSIETIGQYAFKECGNLENIVIPDSVITLGISSFNYCQKAKSIVIGNGVKTISNNVFESCNAVTAVTIGNSVESIGYKAFYGLSYLKNVIIPESVITIGNSAFERVGGTFNKTTFTFLGTTPPTIQAATFYTDYLKKIIVPKGCGDAYKTATNWANFADYIEEATE